MLKQHQLLPLFKKFISGTKNGKRLNKNGTRIKPQTIENYCNCLRLLQELETAVQKELIVYEIKGNNKREHIMLKKYWSNFYKQFTNYLYKQKDCHDNYTGHNIKTIRTFFNWLNNNAGIFTGPYYKNFYITKEEVDIVTLSVEQLQFFVFDNAFENNLSKPLLRCKDIFVFGCMVGLRFSDLCNLTQRNIESRDGYIYLKVRSQKTVTDTLVKLPAQAVEIINKYKNNKSKLLPMVSLVRFNKNLKRLAELAGWVYPISKTRNKRGLNKGKSNTTFRFCDIMSSHIMRRTCITTMLTSGMPEYIVRKISGHTSDSKSFFRYVSLAQSFMDKEIDKMHSHFELQKKVMDTL